MIYCKNHLNHLTKLIYVSAASITLMVASCSYKELTDEELAPMNSVADQGSPSKPNE